MPSKAFRRSSRNSGDEAAMPQSKYRRFDFPIIVERRAERIELTVGDDPPKLIDESILLTEIEHADFGRRFGQFKRFLAQVPNDTIPLPRITLDIREVALHALAYETALRLASPEPVVRISPTAARIGRRLLALPLRIVVIDGAEQKIPDAVDAIFGETNASTKHLAMVVREMTGAGFATSSPTESWPVADILHMGAFDYGGIRVAEQAAWLLRNVVIWQTRLIVLDVEQVIGADIARQIAATIAGRGGPAVIVRYASEPARPLYDRLVHDFPLDSFTTSYGRVPPPVIDSLFGGGGREELLRASSIGEALANVIRDLSRAAPIRGIDESLFEKKRLVPVNLSSDDLGERLERAPRAMLNQFAHDWDSLNFQFHESEGIIPMASAISEIQRTLPPAPAQTPVNQPNRFVNASLWSRGTKAGCVDAQRDRLQIHKTYDFRLQIGPRDNELPVYLSSELLEERIHWTPEMDGVWVEIGVTGIGFHVGGEPLQEVWLPRFGRSEPVEFPVTALRATPVLRYTIYCNGSVLQTFRLAALASLDATRRDLAAALDISLDRLPRGTYVSRPDFGGPIEQAANAPRRTIAIVANHTNGVRVVTVKGKGFLLDEKPGDLGQYVNRAREKLFLSSVNEPAIQLDRTRWPYAYGADRKVNETRLRVALLQLAASGWTLYEKLFPNPVLRQNLEAALAEESDATIQVAHVVSKDVIPWAAIYDRQFDSGAPGTTVCLEALPVDGSGFRAERCGVLPNCPLTARAGVVPPDKKTVACPLHFWGFRNVIEIPPQQFDETGQPLALPTEIRSEGTPQLAAAVNATLPLVVQHEAELATLQQPCNVAWKPIAHSRADVLATLEDLDLDVIYFYCHARGGMADPQVDPSCLEFDANKPPGRIDASQFAYEKWWKHAPLVFINGCSSAAFSPDAISPFVETFVRGRGAGGVIGTEIPVDTQLASKVAYEFLSRFMRGGEAGKILLEVRRLLLAEGNPLGIVYTLYASANLVLKRAS
jgi:hypothetical protein